jgi:hypothetical protein
VLEDRPFSICEFYFSNTDGKLQFEGHSYDNDAKEYYQWRSIVLHIDDRLRRMSYIYETHPVGQTKKDEGFGCNFLRFNDSTKRWDILRGYFLDLDEAQPRHAKMIRFEDVLAALKLQLDPNRDDHRRELVKLLIKHKDDPKIDKIFGWQRNK